MKYNIYFFEAFFLFVICVCIVLFINNANARIISCIDGFNQKDLDKDGRVSFEELEKIQKQEEKETFKMLQEEFEQDDINADNLISFDEYETDFRRVYVISGFKNVDKDKDGFVTCEQIQTLQPRFENKDCENIDKFDQNNDQRLSNTEYSMIYDEIINKDFEKYDKNNDKYIDRNEYDEMFWVPNSSQFNVYIEKNINDDDYLTVAEFCGERYIRICNRELEICEGKSDLEKERCLDIKLSYGRNNSCQWVIKDLLKK